MNRITRRELIASIAGVGAAFFVGGCRKAETASAEARRTGRRVFNEKDVVVASGSHPAKMTRSAVEALGGMGKLVRKGDLVVIKPNIAWNRPAEGAATTNPELVAELVRMALAAGAGSVLVVDHIIDRPAEGVLGFTGIGPAAEKAGARVYAAQSESDYRTVALPKGRVITSDTCIKDVLRADVFINAPIAKVHSATTLTLGMKNLMGCNWDRQAWHASASLDQCIADYASAIRPDLIVLDANRVLLSNGPKGPGQTKDIRKVVAGMDPVAVDAYGATLLGMKPNEISHIKLAHELGVGEIDLSKLAIREV